MSAANAADTKALDPEQVNLAREEERNLISQAQCGSRAAFDHLMNLYENRVFRTAKRLTGNAEDAKDVLQNAFMKAFINLPRFRGESQFYTWLTAITVNEARMLLRRGRRAAEIPIDECQEAGAHTIAWEPLDRRPDPEHEMLSSQLLELVNTHLTAMPLNVQRLIDLHYHKELSLTKCALVVGVSCTAAKSQLYRGMLRLRKSFRQQMRSARSTLNTRPAAPELWLKVDAEDRAALRETRH
jgi:RNA polymerase sigma-70 factor (ECF subfamily)